MKKHLLILSLSFLSFCLRAQQDSVPVWDVQFKMSKADLSQLPYYMPMNQWIVLGVDSAWVHLPVHASTFARAVAKILRYTDSQTGKHPYLKGRNFNNITIQ